MENNVLNSLQLYRSKWFSDLVEENKLSNALLTQPHVISPVLSYIFGTTYGNNVIDMITNGMGKTVTVENREYEWPVMIEHDRAVTIVDAKWQGSSITTTTSSTDTPGIAQTPITVWVKEKWLTYKPHTLAIAC